MLEKEQQIASTISRYPKGKLVMAEPYDTVNLSLLPVFDSSKEALIPIWQGGQVAAVRAGVTGVEDTLDPAYDFRFWLVGTS